MTPSAITSLVQMSCHITRANLLLKDCRSLPEFQQDSPQWTNVFINAISQDPWFIEQIPTTFPEYERLCIKAIEINPATIRAIKRKTATICTKAVGLRPSLLREFLSEDFKNMHADLIRAAVDSPSTIIPANFLEGNPNEKDIANNVISTLPTELLIDVLRKQPCNLRYIPTERADYNTLALEAIEKHHRCIASVPLERRTSQMYEKAFDRTKTDGKFNLALLPDPAISESINLHPTLSTTEKARLKQLAEEQRQNAKTLPPTSAVSSPINESSAQSSEKKVSPEPPNTTKRKRVTFLIPLSEEGRYGTSKKTPKTKT